MTEGEKMNAAYANALDCATEIFKDDVNFMVDYERFELVMWPDDYDLKEYGLSREEYGEVLKRVYRTLSRQQEEELEG